MPNSTVLVTGGCGYVGTKLVPALLGAGHRVRVVDVLLFGNHLPETARRSPALELIEADVRDRQATRRALDGATAVVHLAALANDPSAELDPALTRQVNLEAVLALVDDARRAGVARFINASTATVYGVRSERDVDEDFDHRPITLYGQYKSETDRYIRECSSPGFATVNLRSATVCGWAPRLRLDLTVNILTYHAVRRGRITVFGGAQRRPNVVVDDLVRAYLCVLEAPADAVNGEAFNVCAENHSVLEIAEIVRGELDPAVKIEIEEGVDRRSYHISARKIRDRLGFVAELGIRDGARQVRDALLNGAVRDPEHSVYRNVEHMKAGCPSGR